MNSLKQYNTYKTPDSRQTFCRDKQHHKKLLKHQRRLSELKRIKTIENLRHSKPKDVRNLFKRNNACSANISIDAFNNFFSEL